MIQKSDELKFLVGFFYFSGIRELYEGLKDKPDINIKVLVGLNVDKTNFGLIEFADKDTHLSDEERCHKFLQSVKKSFNSNDFDTQEFYQQVRYFIKLISENKIIIRKTSGDNNRREAILEISALKDELGEDCLQKEKERQKDLSKEIIIAIENQTEGK